MPTVLDTVIHHVDEYDPEYTPVGDVTLPVVSDDEEDGHEENLQGNPQDNDARDPQEIQDTTGKEDENYTIGLQDFNLELDLQEEEEIGATKFTSQEQEYLYWHTKLGHLSKSRMQQLAKNEFFQEVYQGLNHHYALPAFTVKLRRNHGAPRQTHHERQE
jgi:hypothetical protein